MSLLLDFQKEINVLPDTWRWRQFPLCFSAIRLIVNINENLKYLFYFILTFQKWQWICTEVSYFYWTVHRLDSGIKRDQLDVTCFIISLVNAQHISDVNTSILRNLRLICWVISWVVLLWFDVWCGIRMQAEALLQPAYGHHITPANPQNNTNTHRTRTIQPMK